MGRGWCHSFLFPLGEKKQVAARSFPLTKSHLPNRFVVSRTISSNPTSTRAPSEPRHPFRLQYRKQQFARLRPIICASTRKSKSPDNIAADIEISEAENGNLIGHGNAAAVTFHQRANGGNIGDGENTFDIGRLCQQRTECPCAVIIGDRALPSRMMRSSENAGFAQCCTKTEEAAFSRANPSHHRRPWNRALRFS